MDKKYINNNNLVYDLGMHNGDDTDYYLHKGYRVIAVDPNPDFIKKALIRFHEFIEKGQLVLIESAIWESESTRVFYISPNFPHLASLHKNWAAREDDNLTEIEVCCLPIEHLFALYGVPMYLKIDIEGSDELVLDQLAMLRYLPCYLSVEDCRFGFRYLEKLMALGYSSFKLVNQKHIADSIDTTIGYRFSAHASGPMSEDAPGSWIPACDIVQHYSETVRTVGGQRLSPFDTWWDIHCRGPAEFRI